MDRTDPTSDPNLTLVSTHEAAAMLGLTSRALRNWRVRGGGPRYVRISPTCVRYRVAEIDRWIGEREVDSTAAEAQ